ncbi:MAG TPA: peptidyl-prolyl cis-trans isomerase [Candidatus Angelobacter sp.]|jgi:hypothetical protein
MSRIIPIVVLCLVTMGHAQRRGILPGASDPHQPRASQHATSAVAAPPAVIIQARNVASELGGDVAVIKMNGLCPAGGAKDQPACATTVTKDQFEDVLSAVSLGGQVFSPAAVRNVADDYVQNLILADAAEKAGMEKDPRIEELLRIVRVRTLAEAYRRKMEEKYRNPSKEEIEKYYQDNIARYESVRAERLMIPKFHPRWPKDVTGEFQKKAAVVAAEIRERAAAGEPFDRLQNDAFLKLGITPPSMVPETGLRRRATFPAEVGNEIFALKPGEVSHVESESGGYVVYRLIDKPTASLDQMKGEIVRELYQQKMELAVKGTLHAVKTEFNNQYFAPPSTPRALPVEGKTPAPGTGKRRMQPSHSVKLPPVAEKPAAQASKTDKH